MTARVRLVVRGRVQGVNFRWYASEEAHRLGLTGWIRNRADGDVEALAEGDDADVERFASWCQGGPPSARVSTVERERLAGPRRYRDFRIVSDASG